MQPPSVAERHTTFPEQRTCRPAQASRPCSLKMLDRALLEALARDQSLASTKRLGRFAPHSGRPNPLGEFLKAAISSRVRQMTEMGWVAD